MKLRQHPMLILVAVIAALAAFPLIAWAQQEILMTGQDSSGNTRIVRVDASGNLSTEGALGACSNTTMNVGTTGTACPPTQNSARASVLIQLVQSGETLTITTDGSTATATAGAQITSGATYTDSLSRRSRARWLRYWPEEASTPSVQAPPALTLPKYPCLRNGSL